MNTQTRMCADRHILEGCSSNLEMKEITSNFIQTYVNSMMSITENSYLFKFSYTQCYTTAINTIDSTVLISKIQNSAIKFLRKFVRQNVQVTNEVSIYLLLLYKA